MICIVFILILFALGGPTPVSASIPLETRPGMDTKEIQVLRDRIQAVLFRTEKRIKEVFGLKPDVAAILESSDTLPGFRMVFSESSSREKHSAILLINCRIVKDYPDEELRIAVARVLFEAVWRKYRKTYPKDDALADSLYTQGMTAYAAELAFPGSAKWKYSGVPDKQGEHNYQQYLKQERALAADVMSKLGIAEGQDMVKKLFADNAEDSVTGVRYGGRLLSYRIIKSLERILDPKIIQLMGYDEFKMRLLKQLEVLEKGITLK